MILSSTLSGRTWKKPRAESFSMAARAGSDSAAETNDSVSRSRTWAEEPVVEDEPLGHRRPLAPRPEDPEGPGVPSSARKRARVRTLSALAIASSSDAASFSRSRSRPRSRVMDRRVLRYS